jgi:hypothetical protein
VYWGDSNTPAQRPALLDEPRRIAENNVVAPASAPEYWSNEFQPAPTLFFRLSGSTNNKLSSSAVHHRAILNHYYDSGFTRRGGQLYWGYSQGACQLMKITSIIPVF